MTRDRKQARTDEELHRRVLEVQKKLDRGLTGDDVDDRTARRLGQDLG